MEKLFRTPPLGASPALMAWTLAIATLAAAPSASADDEIPLRSWSPPTTAAAAKGGPALHQDLGLSMGVFVPVVPCRVVDTRGNGAPIQGGAFAGGEARTYSFTGRCAGGNPSTAIPPDVRALSLNVTVTQAAGPGFILAYPSGSPQPLVSTLNYVTGQTVANAAIVPSSSFQDQITIVAGVSGTHLIVDVNGYFTDTLNSLEYLSVLTDSDFASVEGFNVSTRDGATGVAGTAVNVDSPSSGKKYGVTGTSDGGPFSAGVRGYGNPNGIPANAAYGVIGDQGAIQTPTSLGMFTPSAGILGRGTRTGVHGLANAPSGGLVSVGAMGCVKNAAGLSTLACGYLAMNDGGATSYGVYSGGNTGASGTKSFVEPHPTDPTKVIRYVSLEGPEAGTYFRGKARVVGGVAIVDVPESFRLVTDEEGLSVHVTPRGPAPSLYVEDVDLSRVVIRSSRDVEFYYVVHGVRKSFRDWQPIADGSEYRPAGPTDMLPDFLAPEQRRALMRNGTYNEDGTVNVQTAERAGWTRAWANEAFARGK